MKDEPSAVGIIANPASGKDIRRLVAHASVFDNAEKVRIVRRIMSGLHAAGVRRIVGMRDYFQICAQAMEGGPHDLTVEYAGPARATHERDTAAAAAAMQRAGTEVILVLGGDGTNRAAALGTCDVPLVSISTGTNNVFPRVIEGTTAGLAAGAIAAGYVEADEVVAPAKLLRLTLSSAEETLALIDVAVLGPGFVGARAIWEPGHLRRVLLTRASASLVGLAGMGGIACRVDPEDDFGLDLTVGGGGASLLAPLAPGLFAAVTLRSAQRLPFGEPIEVEGPCLLALDGERAIELRTGHRAVVSLDRSGPPVVDVERCLALAVGRGLLRGHDPA
jgi:predicted polyphosphate/ATP-dependent NAD kinase